MQYLFMVALTFLSILLLFIPVSSFAGEIVRGSIPADVVSVYDGDTITVNAHPWPGLTIRTAVRLRGIDTPEIRGKCAAEITAALAARDRLAELMVGGIHLENISFDKYGGRVDADVITAQGNAAQILIKTRLGREYGGGKRGGWCGS